MGDVLNLNVETKKEKGEYTDFIMLNTNARSLCPKINSLLDCIEELEASMAIVTETWLADGASLEDDKQDLFLGAGVSMLTKNRKRNSSGVAHGGVALLFREEACNFKEISLSKDGQEFEVLTAVGSLQGHSRKVVAVACYIPPNVSVPQSNACLEHIMGLVIEAKRRYKDPYIIVSGDFNQWRIEKALEEFTDMHETVAGPTRGNRVIDRTFTNFEKIIESRILEPLETDGDDGHIRTSDHRLFYMRVKLRRKERYRWLKYSYRYLNEESSGKFGEWITSKDWSHLVQTEGSCNKADMYQNELNWAISNFFPLITIKRRNIDPPWINDKIRKLIRIRKRIFKDEGGRTENWKKMKKRVNELIEKRKKTYQDSQRIKLLADDAERNFFRNTKNYMSKQRPVPFNVMNMFPAKSEPEVAELLAGHFNSISCEFQPLSYPADVPCTFDEELPVLSVPEVAIRLRKFKKPKSMVKGRLPGISNAVC